VPSIVANTDYDSERMSGCVRRMIERKVDGVAIRTSEIDRHRQCMVMAATAPTRI
jgi:DNA-binding LacI/PurR family transcriptional regulator